MSREQYVENGHKQVKVYTCINKYSVESSYVKLSLVGYFLYYSLLTFKKMYKNVSFYNLKR